MSPEEELKALEELEELERLETSSLASQVDPSLPILGQAMAAQPATNDPGGDEAAEASWVAQGPSAANGKLIVYEPPVDKAREELLTKPALRGVLFEGEEIPDEYIQMMDESSDIYRRYSDFKWTETANAAKGAGKVAYRYSRMPWLQGGEAGLSPLATLSTKLRASADPMVEGALSFILGVDDTAVFGAGRRAGEALDRAVAPGKQKSLSDLITGGEGKAPVQESPIANAVRGGEAVGGVAEQALAGADPEAVNEMLISENPGLNIAGQFAGLFTPLGPAGVMFKGLAGGQKALAAVLGGKKLAQLGEAAGIATKARGVAAQLGAAVPAAAVGGAAVTGARAGVEAAADVVRTGETERTLGGTVDEMTLAALDPVNLALSVGGEAAVMGAGRIARGIRDMPRYGGNVRRVEQLGGKMAFGRGPVGTEGAERAIKAGAERDIAPQDVLAGELAPKIAKVEKEIAAGESAVAKGQIEQARAAKEAAKVGHAEFKEGFFKSREGQQVLAPAETLGTNLKMLREKHAPAPEGGLTPVGDATGVKPARAQFNADIESVSLEPKPGAIELTPDEAEAFLSPRIASKLLPDSGAPPPARGGGGAPPAGPAPGGAPNKQGVNVLKPAATAEAATIPPKGKAAKPAGKVEGPAERDVTPTKFYPESNKARNEYGEAMRPYREAQRADNLRAENLGAGQVPAAKAAAADVDVMAERTSEQLGSQKGGFFRGSDGVERYVKQVSVDAQALDEAAGAAAYQAMGAETLQARAGRHQGKPVVYSERLGDEWKPLSAFDGEATPEMARGYVRGVPADVMLGSWDLANNPQNLMTDGKRVMRIDTGGIGPRSPVESPLQAWEEGLAAFDLDSTGSAAARGELRQKWAGRGKPQRVEMPFALAKSGGAQKLSDVKADLQAGFADVEKAIDAAGGEAGFVKQHYPHLHGEDAKAFAGELGKRRQFLRDNIDKIAMITALGVGASLDDESGGAAAAGVGGLALALKKRGVSKVYVNPRRYNAQQHEVRINQLKTLADNPQMPGAREARELYAAALKDRQQRPLGGRPGGWAEVQKGFSDRLSGLDEGLTNAEKAATKKAAGVLKKTPEAAHKRLVRYSQQRAGELPLKQETEALGARAGVSQGLQDLRLLDPLMSLRHAMTVKRANAPGGMPASPRGMIGAAWDPTALRVLYPGLKSIGGTAGSMLGPRAIDLRDARKDEEKR